MYHTSTHDLRYDILNPRFTQLFMSSKKERPDGKHYGFDHVRKYHDAILYCAKMAEKQLPSDYHFQMMAYIDTMKKEKKLAKGAGKMEEQEADPIPFILYEDICRWCRRGARRPLGLCDSPVELYGPISQHIPAGIS